MWSRIDAAWWPLPVTAHIAGRLPASYRTFGPRIIGDPGNPSDVAGELSIDARNTVVLRDLAVTGSAV